MKQNAAEPKVRNARKNSLSVGGKDFMKDRAEAQQVLEDLSTKKARR